METPNVIPPKYVLSEFNWYTNSFIEMMVACIAVKVPFKERNKVFLQLLTAIEPHVSDDSRMEIQSIKDYVELNIASPVLANLLTPVASRLNGRTFLASRATSPIPPIEDTLYEPTLQSSVNRLIREVLILVRNRYPSKPAMDDAVNTFVQTCILLAVQSNKNLSFPSYVTELIPTDQAERDSYIKAISAKSFDVSRFSPVFHRWLGELFSNVLPFKTVQDIAERNGFSVRLIDDTTSFKEALTQLFFRTKDVYEKGHIQAFFNDLIEEEPLRLNVAKEIIEEWQWHTHGVSTLKGFIPEYMWQEDADDDDVSNETKTIKLVRVFVHVSEMIQAHINFGNQLFSQPTVFLFNFKEYNTYGDKQKATKFYDALFNAINDDKPIVKIDYNSMEEIEQISTLHGSLYSALNGKFGIKFKFPYTNALGGINIKQTAYELLERWIKINGIAKHIKVMHYNAEDSFLNRIIEESKKSDSPIYIYSNAKVINEAYKEFGNLMFKRNNVFLFEETMGDDESTNARELITTSRSAGSCEMWLSYKEQKMAIAKYLQKKLLGFQFQVPIDELVRIANEETSIDDCVSRIIANSYNKRLVQICSTRDLEKLGL